MNSYKIEDLEIGQTESFDTEVTENMMNLFLKMSGDKNPLHKDIRFARSFGYKDKVVFGLLLSSFYSRLVGVYLPGKYALLTNINIDFLKAVFVHDKITVIGEIVDIDNRFNFISVHSKIIRNNKDDVSKAKIRVGFND